MQRLSREDGIWIRVPRLGQVAQQLGSLPAWDSFGLAMRDAISGHGRLEEKDFHGRENSLALQIAPPGHP